jgi:hypothetical protein
VLSILAGGLSERARARRRLDGGDGARQSLY